MKSKLRYEKVYTRRNVRDPIDWNRIEEVRNEGWELISFIGTPAESAKNPTVAPLYAVFRPVESLVASGSDEIVKKLRAELQAAKMQIGRLKKKVV